MAERDGLAEIGRGAWRRLRRSIATDLQRTVLYRQLALRARAPQALAGRLRDLRPGDPQIGRKLLEGVFVHGGEKLTAASPADVWERAGVSERFSDWLQGFSWMRDLLAADPERAPKQARALFDAWLARFGKWDKGAWSPGPTSRRVYFWLADAPTLFPDDDLGSPARLDALARHARHLEHLIALPLDDRDVFAVAIALAASGACLPDMDRLLETGLDRCAVEARRQILSDGGHVSRSPEAGAELLADLYALDDAVNARGRDVPEAVRRAIDRLAPMLRFFLMPDGGLASFHGGGEGDRGLIEALLACDEAGGKTFEFAPHSGYHRVAADGGTTLVLDVGGPPPGGFSVNAHASCLAFELGSASGRLVINCGWSEDQPERFREPVRATAAHSTLVVADTSSMRLLKPGLKRELLGPRPAVGPGQVAVRRNEEERGVWIEGSHEGYRQFFGLVHRRRIYVADAGEDVRGEDTLFRSVEDSARAEPAATEYAVRFHLAPGVTPEVARDRRSAVLVQPSGEAWRFRTDVGPIESEPSIHLAGSAPKETRQLVLKGTAKLEAAIDRPPNRVRWAFQKLGRAPAA